MIPNQNPLNWPIIIKIPVITVGSIGKVIS
jgi:hypothetical protein